MSERDISSCFLWCFDVCSRNLLKCTLCISQLWLSQSLLIMSGKCLTLSGKNLPVTFKYLLMRGKFECSLLGNTSQWVGNTVRVSLVGKYLPVSGKYRTSVCCCEIPPNEWEIPASEWELEVYVVGYVRVCLWVQVTTRGQVIAQKANLTKVNLPLSLSSLFTVLSWSSSWHDIIQLSRHIGWGQVSLRLKS